MIKKRALVEMVCQAMKVNPDKIFNYKQLASLVGAKDNRSKQLVTEILYDLKTQGQVDELSTGKFRWIPSDAFTTGKIDMTAKGSAFLTSADYNQDIFITSDHLHHALNGDTVRILVFAHSPQKRPEGEVVEILERKQMRFVGIMHIERHYSFLAPTERKMPDIIVPKELLRGVKNGEKAIVEITQWEEYQKNPVGKVLKVLGAPGNNDTEMNAIMAEFDLPVEFPTRVEKAAEKISFEITDAERAGRRDFRDILTFTIDPRDAKDFDDAISFRRLEHHCYEIGVHIADVSYYVNPDSALDAEAYDRATSVYLVDRTIPMLPERLSNGVCSLRPDEEKLCFSAVFEVNDKAQVEKEWFGRTVIKSNRRYAYEEVQAILKGEDGDYAEELRIVNTLTQTMRQRRMESGAINFDRQEVRFEIDENGKPLSVYMKRSLEANQLIEELMLLANQKVAERIGCPPKGEHPKTFVYRIHEQPDPEKLKEFSNFIRKFGYKLQNTDPKRLSSSMNRLIEEVHERPESNLIETLAVRTMPRAYYSTENKGHYGLAMPYYTHFTSPIRRYPDVMVHRLLQRYLDNGRSVNADKYEDYCKHSSEMEYLAASAERASIKYKQVEFMMDKVGEELEGTITGVTTWGFYVELMESHCEGLVPMGELEGDFYDFDEKNYRIVGRRGGKVYQLGDTLKVQVLSCNLQEKQLTFTLPGQPMQREKSNRFVDDRRNDTRRRGRRASDARPKRGR